MSRQKILRRWLLCAGLMAGTALGDDPDTLKPKEVRPERPAATKGKDRPSSAETRRANAAKAMTPAVRELIEQQLLFALDTANWPLVAEVTGEIAKKTNDLQVEAIDEFLTSQSRPSLAEIIATAHLRMVEQNVGTPKELPKGKELVLTLAGIRSFLDDALDERRRHEAFQDLPAGQPRQFADFERRLWDSHVLDSRLEAAWRVAQYGWKLTQVRRPATLRNLSAEQQAVLDTDYAELARQLVAMRRELNERALALRVRRIARAGQMLAESPALKDRFQASFALDWDGDMLAEYFRWRGNAQGDLDEGDKTLPESTEVSDDTDEMISRKDAANVDGAKSKPNPREVEAVVREEQDGDESGKQEANAPKPATLKSEPIDLSSVTHHDLSDPRIGEQLRATLHEGRTLAGADLITKSRLLFTGMHWWFRGRYGVGTDSMGLMKNERSLKSPEAMFALYMPRVPPKPTDPFSQGTPLPLVDRRHHYVWRLSNERIVESRELAYDKVNRIVFLGPGSKTIVTTYFY